MTTAGTSRASDKIHVCQNESCVFSHRNKSDIFKRRGDAPRFCPDDLEGKT